jgi:4-amino-4-deoxy-L-arabinose transferase-like glycosyltransferase
MAQVRRVENCPKVVEEGTVRGAMLVAMAAAVTMLSRLWEGDLYGDQVLYAAVAKGIRVHGDWVHLWFGSDPYWRKPPLVFWAVAGLSSVLGPTTLAARLVPAICGVASCVLVWAIARRLFDARVALVAGLVLATTPPFLRDSAGLRLDPVATCATLTALVCWLRGLDAGGRALDFVLAGIAWGFAVMAKGAFGLVGPFMLVVYLLVLGRWRDLVSSGVIVSVVVGTIVCLPWHAWEVATWGPRFLDVYLRHEIADRMSGALDLGIVPVSYPVALVRDAWPWVVFMAIGAVDAVARGRRGERRALVPLAWTLAYLALIHVSRVRRAQYLLPLYPAASMLAALGVVRVLPDAWMARLPRAVLVMSLVAALVLNVVPMTVRRPRQGPLLALVPHLPPDAPLAGWRTSEQLRAASLVYLGRDVRPMLRAELVAEHPPLVLSEVEICGPLTGFGFEEVHRNERYALFRPRSP